jgi:hypothetical protein
MAQQIIGGAIGGIGALAKTGAFGPAGWLTASDARLKDDVEEVGTLHDGSPVYSFRYRGDPVTQIGLIAQDVEARHPDAVAEIGGVKAVDYAKATALAGILGRLR